MRKVRIYLTLDWDSKSVVESTKAKEVKADITNELTALATDLFAEHNPADIKVRFLRTSNSKIKSK